MIWTGRIPRRNKIRLRYKRIQRMHPPPTNGAIDMHWMSYQLEKNTNVYIECVLTRNRCPCENWESTMMSYHTSATTAATFSLGTIKNRGGGWWNQWSIPFSYCIILSSIHVRIPYRIGKAPTTVHLVRIVSLQKNDDGYAFGTPQTPHIFSNTHHPSRPSYGMRNDTFH
jgi:hypothetical protein